MATSYEIDDIRESKDFRGISFSGFKKTDVKKELLNSLYNSKIEPACYWSAEMICAGHFLDLWNIIIGYYTKHIHVGNPKIVVYLDLRINNFKDLVQNGYSDNEMRLRNNARMRRLFCEVMCVLCDAKKYHSIDEVKVRKTDFDLTQITERLQAPNVTYAQPIFREDDPKEVFIAINELAFNLSEEGKNLVNCCYWIEWLLEFESICKGKKEGCYCERRTFATVATQCQMDLIWLVWDLFLYTAKRYSPLIQKAIQSALNIFCLKYTPAMQKKRKLLLYFVVGLLTDNAHYDEEIVRDKEKVQIVTENINNVYRQIKKNEHSTKTGYLHANDTAKNLEETIEKLEQMSSLGAEFVPRL